MGVVVVTSQNCPSQDNITPQKIPRLKCQAVYSELNNAVIYLRKDKTSSCKFKQFLSKKATSYPFEPPRYISTDHVTLHSKLLNNKMPRTSWGANTNYPQIWGCPQTEKIRKVRFFTRKIDQMKNYSNLVREKIKVKYWCSFCRYAKNKSSIFSRRNYIFFRIKRLERWQKNLLKTTIKNSTPFTGFLIWL